MSEVHQPDPFAGPKLKIKRAERHIADYRLAHKAFTESGAVRCVVEDNPDTWNIYWGIHYAANPATGDMRVTAADAIYNLRAALDQAVSRCVKLARQSPKGTYFPQGQDKAGFETSLRGKCKKVPESIRAAIAALEPYQGGAGYLFRVLHDLNVVDKHTDLLDVALAVQKRLIPLTQVRLYVVAGVRPIRERFLEFGKRARPSHRRFVLAISRARSDRSDTICRGCLSQRDKPRPEGSR